MYKFEKLEVYKKSLLFNKEIFNLTNELPSHLKFSLADQLISAPISISANIAEGSGRISNKESRNFYNIAKGSVYEVISLLDISLMQNYITKDKYDKLYLLSE